MKALVFGLILVALFASFSTISLAADPSLMAYYNFDEGSGKVVKDLSRNGNDGTFTGKLEWVDGKYGKAVAAEYPKVTDAQIVIVPDSPSLDISDEITMMAWAKLSTLPVGSQCPTAMTKRLGGPGNYQLLWRANPNGQMCFWANVADSRSPKCVLPAVDEWHHVARTFGSNTLKFYQDGKNCDTQERATPLTPNDFPLCLFTDTFNNCNYVGTITLDEVAIFDRVLSDDEISETMNEGLGDLGFGAAVDASGKLFITWANIKREINSEE